MAFSPIISWQIDGEQMETVIDFLGLQNHCTLWWKQWNSKILALWKKSHDKHWQCIKKQWRHFAEKSLYTQLWFFQLSCMDIRVRTVKTECQRTDALELSSWRRLLRLPWTARKQISQSKRKSTLNIHWMDWCWTWSSNILVTWCTEPAHWKRL